MVRTGSYSERAIERIVEKSVRIIEKYFARPVKMVDAEVPFREDELRIRFRKPVDMSYFVSFSRNDFGSKRYVRSNVWVYLDRHPATELEMAFTNNQLWYVRVIYDNGDVLWIDMDAVSALNVLLVSGIFDRLSEAEMSSKHGEADKWLYEFLRTFREIRNNINYPELSNPDNLFDTKAVTEKVDIHFLGLRAEYTYHLDSHRHVEVGDLELVISYMPGEGVLIRALERLRGGRVIESGEVRYSLSERRIVYNQIDETILAEFPVGVLDALEGFLERFFETYLAALIAVRSMQV